MQDPARFDGLNEKELLYEIALMMQRSDNADIIPLADLLSIYLLPPAFLTGWFGMNFQGLPFIDKQNSWKVLINLCFAYGCTATAILAYRKNPYSAVLPGATLLGFSEAQRFRLRTVMFTGALFFLIIAVNELRISRR